MDEEEPMDISLENSLSSSFHDNSYLNATIATASPASKERKDIISHNKKMCFEALARDADFKLHLKSPLKQNDSGYVSKPIRRLHMNIKQKSPDKIGKDQEEKPSKRLKREKNHNKKPGVFHNSKGKLFLWGIFIIIFFVVRFLIFNNTCIPNFEAQTLDSQIEKLVFGQHIATELIKDVLNMYFDNSTRRNHTELKPLIISFHGWTGVGKNLLTSIVTKSFTRKNVKLLLVPLHFSDITQNAIFQKQLPLWIKSNITLCKVNLFIFDEMDKAPSGLLEGLHEIFSELKSMHLDGTWNIFILLSNSRGGALNKYLFSQLAAGRTRESLTAQELLPVLMEDSENEWYSKLASSQLIDKFVPFLPLTLSHVRKCVQRDIISKGGVPSPRLVEGVVKEMNYFSPKDHDEQYSYTGCKRVSDKVDLHMISD